MTLLGQFLKKIIFVSNDDDIRINQIQEISGFQEMVCIGQSY